MKWLKYLLAPVLPSRAGLKVLRDLHDAVTHSVVLRLDPLLMDDPDLQVRWDIEKLLEVERPALPFFDDGYGFAKHSEAMMLVYATSEPDRFIKALTRILEQEHVRGNRLAPAAVIGVTQRVPVTAPGGELSHRIVYPPGEAGKPVPD